jgi:hypothetical protein
MDGMQFLYKPGDEKEYFGKDFLFKDEYYSHSTDTKIAEIISDEKHKIEVFSYNAPAQFFTFKVDDKFKLTTGSGSWERYKNIFELLKDGMLGIHEVK